MPLLRQVHDHTGSLGPLGIARTDLEFSGSGGGIVRGRERGNDLRIFGQVLHLA